MRTLEGTVSRLLAGMPTDAKNRLGFRRRDCEARPRPHHASALKDQSIEKRRKSAGFWPYISPFTAKQTQGNIPSRILYGDKYSS